LRLWHYTADRILEHTLTVYALDAFK